MAVEAPFLLADLPVDCFAIVVSLTSPRDACRLSLLSKKFVSLAASNAVWHFFLPPDYASILSRSSAPPSVSSKKELYLALSDKPLLIDNGLKSFQLDKCSGKKCYMLSVGSLSINWGGTPRYWTLTSAPEARFEEVAELVDVCWLEIRGYINTRMLSPSTLYAAYLVFKFNAGAYGFKYQPVDVSVGIAGSDSNIHWRTVFLDAGRGPKPQYLAENPDLPGPTQRSDGWLEIELGDFFNGGEVGNELQMVVNEIRGGGLIIEGIEIRPKLNM